MTAVVFSRRFDPKGSVEIWERWKVASSYEGLVRAAWYLTTFVFGFSFFFFPMWEPVLVSLLPKTLFF